jgi:alpha-beta hydrolase superfamily lysophospholipase
MTDSKPVIVIIPGGFCSPEVYQPVADLLEQNGFTVIIPRLTVTKNLISKDPASQAFQDLSQKGLLDDVKEIHDCLASEFEKGSEVVIFGHSYGSLPALLAIEGHTIVERKAKGLSGGIKGYVAVAGFAYAQKGKNARGDTEPAPPMPYFEHEVCQSPTLHVIPLTELITGWGLPHDRGCKASLLQRSFPGETR